MKSKHNADCLAVLKSLSNGTRMDIIRILLKKSCNVSQIGAALNKRQPCISQNLRILKDSGMIEAEVEGKYRIYTINDKYLQLLTQLTCI